MSGGEKRKTERGRDKRRGDGERDKEREKRPVVEGRRKRGIRIFISSLITNSTLIFTFNLLFIL